MGQMQRAHRRGEGRASAASRRPARSTQMIVGADDADRRDVLATSAPLYGDLQAAARLLLGLQPDPGAERHPAARRRRRCSARTGSTRPIGCCAITASPSTEIASGGEDGMLDLDIDPKLAWALKNRRSLPGRRQHGRARDAAARAGARRSGRSTRSSRRAATRTLRLDDVARLSRRPEARRGRS